MLPQKSTANGVAVRPGHDEPRPRTRPPTFERLNLEVVSAKSSDPTGSSPAACGRAIADSGDVARRAPQHTGTGLTRARPTIGFSAFIQGCNIRQHVTRTTREAVRRDHGNRVGIRQGEIRGMHRTRDELRQRRTRKARVIVVKAPLRGKKEILQGIQGLVASLDHTDLHQESGDCRDLRNAERRRWWWRRECGVE